MSHHRLAALIVLACATLGFPVAAFAQSGGGIISGTAVDADGAAVANTQVQAVNARTKSVYKTAGSAQGEFALTDLPAGNYDVTIVAPGFYAVTKTVPVAATEPARVNVHLLEYQLGTLGDGREFRVQLTSPHGAPSGPTPRTADGKPDLTGVWYAQRTIDPGKPQPLPWARKLLTERAANNGKDAPGARCLPRGITNAGALFPFKLVQTPTLLVMLFEDDIPSHRQVFLDGRGHPADPNPLWMGHSIGHWEGDTLVIDTVGFDDRSWLDPAGHPHTEKMRVMERFRRPDRGHLEVEFTIDDPGAYAKPWKIERVAELDTSDDVGEYVCTEDEKDAQHMVGK